MKFDLTLYLVTDSTYQTEDHFLHIIEEACMGGITLLQLREKEKSGKEYLDIAQKVKIISDKYNIPLIIDDRIDIAMAIDATGVHVGASDIPVKYARKLLGANKIVGVTAKTVLAAQQAYEDGADYLGVGAIFPTTTKVKTQITEVATLNAICKSVPIPIVAIGGLNSENVTILNNSPMDGVAVVSAIMKSDNPKQSAIQLKDMITGIKNNNR
ncbi:thiamine phosphate synthase [Paludicola sp. MB14-C6]|uniref:thiamine phosphate synthase n=1 Tax=Paludihabitans sp. MB14-C6 TaxID=3070656 RepID=UPI0027DB73B4|nr:thiamine phosphate synthase [Paludicola sp. MB14-C6]WMJ23252.1 thiamine phosphate synthase [Paludicola sp. MB14-C6]